ncbi:MAG: ribonuclease H-like domain-containing protein [Candidatus Methanofastidiosa archaeon]|jgi:uncharacterized protein YprB with RNaseH-like and TPR domain|nr:ribonuclease H-like domain-containing protein [Candidatus Methanofastidiosa archaeon]MDD4281730.1 ribonuclease H-like domain-containing protein [Candidatus Methanofastidiosa archaeon]
MIRRSFIILDGIGEYMEQAIWRRGITSWDAFRECQHIPRIAPARKALYDGELAKAQANLACRNEVFFSYRLPSGEHWRTYEAFKDSVAYLDIETTGSSASDVTTMVGIYDGSDFRVLVRDDDLSAETLSAALEGKKLLVTFFGRGFDVPVLQREFGVPMPQLHYDLCFAGKRVGLSGGLKRIEKEMGIGRSDETDGLSGWDAVRLWHQHTRGDPDALETLIQYNREDVVNLECLAHIIYQRLEGRGF